MSHTTTQLPLIIGLRSAIVLLALIIGLRLLGKRQIGQMNVYDLALVMLLANAVQNAMTEGKGDLPVGIVSAGVLILAGRLLTWLLVRRPALEARIIGSPTVLLSDGRLIEDRMRREQITEEEIMTALRQHGLADPRDAKLVVLEVDGTLSVVPREMKA